MSKVSCSAFLVSVFFFFFNSVDGVGYAIHYQVNVF